jgi:hypothetical protein
MGDGLGIGERLIDLVAHRRHRGQVLALSGRIGATQRVERGAGNLTLLDERVERITGEIGSLQLRIELRHASEATAASSAADVGGAALVLRRVRQQQNVAV